MNLTVNGAIATNKTSEENVLVFLFNEHLCGLHLSKGNARRFFKTNGYQHHRLVYSGITEMGNKKYSVIER